MSLPAMLVGETIVEILQASQFAREIVSSVCTKFATEDPKTPLSQHSNPKADPENTELRAKRRKEKQNKQQSDSSPLPPQRARSRINFKVSPPKKVRDLGKEKENNNYLANRVSPRNRQWVDKTVLFPDPLFSSTTSSSHQQHFCETRSPIISRNRVTTSPHKILIKSPNRVTTTSSHKFRIKSPHRYLIKSPPPSSSKFQGKIKGTPIRLSSPKRCGAALKSSRPLSPSRLAAASTKSKKSDGIVCLSKSSPKRSAASKFRRSFSPSRLITRLVLPLKSNKNVAKIDGLVSGLKQRPAATTMQFPGPRFNNIL